MKTKPLIRRVIGLPLHRAHRPVDAPSLAANPSTSGRHSHGLAEVFRRRFSAAIDARDERLNELGGHQTDHPSDQSAT